MKTSQVLASLFFSGLAAAAPIAANKRDLVWKTEYVVVTEVVYTTVYDDDWDVPEATTTPAGSFYAVPEVSTSAEVKPTSTPSPTPTPAYTSPVETSSSIYTPPVVASSSIYTPSVVASSSIYTPPVVESSSIYTPPVVETPTSSATPTPTPEPVTSATPEPTTSAASQYVAAVASVSSAAVPVASAYAAAPVASSGASGEYSGDLTIYDNNGGFGACGTALHDTDMIVALAQPAWGASTYDVMTGAATNKWCGQKIQVNYNGKSVVATIMDMCPGCTGDDIDLSLAAWNALGMVEKTRIKGTWSKMD